MNATTTNRVYSFENKPEVVSALNDLLSKSSPQAYRKKMYQLGLHLAAELAPKLNKRKSYCLATTAEDADYLAKGLSEGICDLVNKVSIACFWNDHHIPVEGQASTAPIIKKFIDASAMEADDIIIVKSVMSGSCVVKTNLTELIQRMTPNFVYVVSPVAHINAEERLKQEFSADVSKKFDFTFLAKDTERNTHGEVIPGIGGNVYELLDFEARQTPKAVLDRILLAQVKS